MHDKSFLTLKDPALKSMIQYNQAYYMHNKSVLTHKDPDLKSSIE